MSEAGDDAPVADPALRALFAEEAGRHAQAIAAARGGGEASARALHAVRGAAAMLGLARLAGRAAAAEARTRGGDAAAARAFLAELAEELDALGLDAGAVRAASAGAAAAQDASVERASDEPERAPSDRPASPPPPPASRSSLAASPSAPPDERVSALAVSAFVANAQGPGAARASAPGEPRASWGSGERPSLDPDVLAFFFSEARARLEHFGDALGRLARTEGAAARDALDEGFRHMHALKGAASTVGLPSIAGAAHALEGALAHLRARAWAPDARELDALASARARLAVALAAPAAAAIESEAMVTVLRGAGLLREADVGGASAAGGGLDRARGGPRAEVIRVPVSAVAGLAASVGEVGFVGDRMAQHAVAVREYARALAEAAAQTDFALRRIGPPRPWGAPVDALERLGDVARMLSVAAAELEREGERLAHDADTLGSLATGAREGLERLGGTEAKWLFDRVAPAAEALAQREGKALVVVRAGEDTGVSRALAERLVEPLAQLVRNAVTHGVEAPATRRSRGKPARATLRLAARAEAGRLKLTVEDDGAGVDVPAVAARAVAMGALSSAAARDPERVLRTLFLSGLSTRTSADTAAGRGVGLDLVARELAQLGASINVRSRRHAYTRFEVDVPMRSIAQRALVVFAAGQRVAVPLERVRRVTPARALADGAGQPPPAPRSFSLAAALGAESPRAAGTHVWLEAAGDEPLAMAVVAVERAREFVVEPLPPLLVGVGPWAAATVDGEGRVLLVLDVDRVCADAQRRGLLRAPGAPLSP